MNKTIIIAEVGPNHNGKLKLAYKLVDVAKRAGADFVKFQTSIPEDHISIHAKKAIYQMKSTNKKKSQLSMANKMTLSFKDFEKLKSYCNKKKIKFLSTPFGFKAINFLKKLNMEYYKIPSGEINNLLYLEKIGKIKKKVILSTGMSNMKEIAQAIKILVSSGTKKNNITVLQCNTEYPTPLEDVNIKAMLEIKKKFRINVGYSDHTLGINASIVAVANGAKIIEKHITLNKKMSGPDHKASITEKELKNLVSSIRETEIILGQKEKKLSKSEKKNIMIARNSIVANIDIKKGDKFTKKNLTIKRPGYGISPMNFYKVLGKKATRNFKKDELIKI